MTDPLPLPACCVTGLQMLGCQDCPTRPSNPERMTTSNDDAVREVTRQQRAERRNKTSTPRNDEPTTADLTRELHLMQTQVETYGYPGTRAVLALIGDLRKEVYRLRTERDRYWQALTDIAGYEGWQTPGVPAAKAMGDIARAALPARATLPITHDPPLSNNA